MTVTANFVPMALLTTGIGVVMIGLGLRRGMLSARFDSRRCASCGRKIGAGVCRNCAHR
jgi:hypothetical protein